MIDWTKPIETVDGRAARKIQTVQNELWNVVFVPGENFGDVFLINDEGCICGERTILRIRKPFIRNVRIKREGWVVARASIAAAPIIERTRLYATQKEAQAGCVLEKSFPMFVSWEE